jgi:type IV pilus assembly protein PilW
MIAPGINLQLPYARERMITKMKRANGFSLVELMISLVLGSVVTAGVVQLFVANSETHRLLQGQSRMQESVRFAFDFIGRDVRKAGYLGCFSSNDDLHTTLINPDNPAIPYEYDLTNGLTGFDATAVDVWTPSITNVLPYTNSSGTDVRVFSLAADNYGAENGIDLDEITSGTDIVTFRNLSAIESRIAAPLNSSAVNPVINVGVGWNEFRKDQLVMIHDCAQATIFRVTSITPNLAGTTSTINQNLTIGHAIGDIDPTGNITAQMNKGSIFQIDAAISAIESNTYYIRPGTGFNNSGQHPLSLWKKSSLDRPVELIEGVEDLQLLYGEDTDDDGVPNQYVPANFVTNWLAIVTVRVTIVVNSIDDVGGTSLPTQGCIIQNCIEDTAFDGLIRRAFTQTIQLRNHS